MNATLFKFFGTCVNDHSLDQEAWHILHEEMSYPTDVRGRVLAAVRDPVQATTQRLRDQVLAQLEEDLGK